MKKLFILLTLVIAGNTALAQKEQVAFDENNKYIFYQVNDMPGINADTLYNRCVAGLSRIGPKPLYKPTMVANTSVDIKAIMMIYSSTGPVKHEEGELTYALHIEFKNDKYRFWLTDFVFAPYQRNRYGIYERSRDEAQPMEAVKTKYNARMFEIYLEQIAKYGSQFGADLKKVVANPAKSLNQPTKIDTRNW